MSNVNKSRGTALFFSLALLLGCGVGWFFAHKQGKKELKEAVDLMVEGGESSDAYFAALAVHAINVILSGDTNGAVRTLSRPVERYYTLYKDVDNDQGRKKMRAAIEDLVRTNSVAAEAIKKQMESNK
jgi:hypothetical protein